MSKGVVQGIPSSVAASLLSQSVIEAVVPAAPDLDSLSLIVDDDTSQNGASLISRIPHRKTLYLDELIPVHVLLKTPFVAENIFKPWLARLSIKLDAYGVGTQPRPESQRNARQPAPTQNIKEVLDGCVVDSSIDPMIAVGTETAKDAEGSREPAQEAESRKFIYVLWKEELHICLSPGCTNIGNPVRANRDTARSRLRNRDLSIYLSATCSLLPSSPGTTDEVLTTGQTSSPNLFAAMSHDPSFHGRPPVLTAARLSKHMPAGFVDQNTVRPIKNANRALMQAVSSLSTKLRCLRTGGSPNTAQMLASIDIETNSSLRDSRVSLDSIDVLFSDGKAVPVCPTPLPHAMGSGNCTAFVYELHPTTSTARRTAAHAASTPAQHALTFRLKSTILERDPSDPTMRTPRRLSTQWRTTVDLASLRQPPTSAPASAPQRILTTSKSKRTTAIPAPAQNPASPTLTLAITAAAHRVRTGATTTWTVQLSNRSGAPGPTRPRTLRLRLIPLVDAADPAALLPLVPAQPVPRLAPGASATVALRLRVPAVSGVCRFVGLRVEDLDAMDCAERDDKVLHGKTAVLVAGGMVPDVVAEEGEGE